MIENITPKELVAHRDLHPATRAIVNLLARIDQSLTGKEDCEVWHTLSVQLPKIEDIILGRDVYYLSDGGLSRLSLDCTAENASSVAFVSSNSTERVKWLWNYEKGFRVQLYRALAAWVWMKTA